MAQKQKLQILHRSVNYLVINKPFDLVMNSDDPQRISLHSLMKEQFPEAVNNKLKVSCFWETLEVKVPGSSNTTIWQSCMSKIEKKNSPISNSTCSETSRKYKIFIKNNV